MRFLLRFLLGLVIFVGVLGLIGGGAVYAYGQYGITFVEDQLHTMEESFAQEIKDENPGTNVEVHFNEIYYKMAGFTSFSIAFKVDAKATLESDPDTTVEERTVYVAIDVLGMVTGGGEAETYEDDTAWAAVSDGYKDIPPFLFDSAKAQSTAFTIIGVSGGAIVLSIVLRILLRKRRGIA